MEILTKPLNSFNFDDIVSFQKQNHPEGIELDYKKVFPDKGLAKIIASFANTRGGVIILGIEEDKKTGLPISANGIVPDKHDDRVYQYVGNINPIPKVVCHTTNEVHGKVFVLIRVFEGDETPYYVYNDSNIWIRTGNISKPIDIVSPEGAELLYKKSERAEIGRIHNLDSAEANFQAFIKRAEKQRVREIEIEKENYEIKKVHHEDGDSFPPFKSQISQSPVGKNVSLLKIIVQPYYPRGEFVRPLDIEPIIVDSRSQNNVYEFPANRMYESIKEGMIFFNWSRRDGEIQCQQIFANGLGYSIHDVLRPIPDGQLVTHLGWFAGELYITLSGMRKILEKFGYQGALIGKVSIENIEGVIINPIIERMFPGDTKSSVFAHRAWPLILDTRILSETEKLREFVTELVRDIHWTFGYKDVSRQISAKYLVDKGYLRET